MNETVDKLMFSYHYQDKNAQLIFRYDNSAHKPKLPFTEHKHLQDKIIAANSPDIEDVLLEIITIKNWLNE